MFFPRVTVVVSVITASCAAVKYNGEQISAHATPQMEYVNGAELHGQSGHTLIAQIHFSHEGGRQMKKLLNEGFGMLVNRELGMRQEFGSLCSNSTDNYKSLLDRGVRAVEQEHGVGHNFPPALSHECPEEVAFMTVMRDPVAYEIRKRWDFKNKKITKLTLPERGGHGNTHIESLNSLGGLASDTQNPQEALKYAKSVLGRFATVCITEHYQDCPLLMAVGMRAEMTQEDIAVLGNRFLDTNYASQDNTGHLADYTEIVKANGTLQEKQWLREVQDILSPETELYDFANRLYRSQLKAAKEALRAAKHAPQPRQALQGDIANISHMLQVADTVFGDIEDTVLADVERV